MIRTLSAVLVVTCVSSLSAGCAHPELSPSKLPRHVQEKHYFPGSEFNDLTYDSILVSSFEKHLASLGEPTLYDQPNVQYAVRVTWMTPFYGDAVLRIEDNGNEINFTYKRRPSIAAPDTKTNVDSHGELTRAAFARLTSEIRRENFFSITNQQNVDATDGTIWLLEVYDGEHYHAVYRIGPFSAPVQNIGRLAANLADVHIKDLE